MALSRDAKKAFKKALKEKKKRRRGHWLLIQKGDSAKEVISKLFTQLCVIVLIGCVGILGNELRLSLSAQLLNSSLQKLYSKFFVSEGNGELSTGAKKLLKINPDTVGWITIDGTHIDLPVVQRKQSDGNKYYLKYAFDGSKNKAGTIFLDCRAVLNAKKRSDNLVLYGHNQKDKTMFGDLAKYKGNIEFYKEHPTVTFSSNYRSDKYKIFGYFVTPVLESQTSDGYVFKYNNYIDFSSKSEYKDFIENIAERSQIITDVDVEYGDRFLTLSTCSNEFEPSRFVVFARRVREDEDENVDVSAAYINKSAKEPEWSVIYS